MFFFLICKTGDWSLNTRFISRDFFNNYVDRLSRKQLLKVKTCPNNITVVLENMSDRHMSAYYRKQKKSVTSIILRVFLEILSYQKEKPFDITTNTIPI